jgi:hypothetical protein
MAIAKEERYGSVLECGGEGRVDGGDSVDPTTTIWRWPGWWRRRRGHEKFWQPDDV